MTAAHFSVTVASAAPGVEAVVVVTLSAGATVDDAIALSGIVARLNLDAARLEPAIFGQRVNGRTPLAPGDRIELTRPLIADPKRARRKRAGDRSRSKPDSRQKVHK
jgi:putative ubiquitin-RnfH superfamily antitoxin RatB of RatAB toxin-antitoxin module